MDASNNEIDSIGLELAALTRLHTLRLSFNHISSVATFAHPDMASAMRRLTNLNLAHNNISDLTGLETLTMLSVLDLCDNRLSELTQLQPLTQLDWLRDLALQGMCVIL